MEQLYNIKEETLTSIADNVRALSGTTDLLSTTEISDHIALNANEVDNQTILLQNIINIMRNKTADLEQFRDEIESQTNTLNAIQHELSIKAPVPKNVFTIDYDKYYYEENMTWRDWINTGYDTTGYEWDTSGKYVYITDDWGDELGCISKANSTVSYDDPIESYCYTFVDLWRF